jgi:uncharacterized protein
MTLPHNPVGWFEIPVLDMDRAIRFYNQVFSITLERHTLGLLDMAWFPGMEGGVGTGGSLVAHPEHYRPSTNGVLIYFTAFSGDVDIELGRVVTAGGQILRTKTQISPEVGYMALFLDTEGNRIALHSRG